MPTKCLLVISICVTLFCGWVTFAELRPFFNGGLNREARLEQHINGAVHIGLSNFSHSFALNDCLHAMTSVEGRLLPTQKRASVLESCQTQANQITQLAPTNSLAWFTWALSASIRGDFGELNHSLEMSRRTGENEQWIAELRVGLAEEQFKMLTRQNREGHQQDLELLVRSQRGIKQIALRYLTQDNFKRRITTLVEQMDEESQRRFVDRVRFEAEVQGVI